MIFKTLCFLGLVFVASNTSAYSVELFFLSNTQADTTRVIQLLEDGEQAGSIGDYSKAIKLIRQADSLAANLEFTKGREIALGKLGEIYVVQGKYDTAIDLINEAIEQYPENSERYQYHNLLGRAYKFKEEFSLSIENFNKAIEFLDRLPGDEKQRIKVGMQHNLAVAYQSAGQKNEAFKNFLIAIEYAEAARDSSFLTIIYNNLGLAYTNFDEYEKSVYYLEKALEYAEQINSKMDRYRAHLNLANAQTNMEDFENALHNYGIAEELFIEMRPNMPPAIILHNRGALLAKMGRYAEAEQLLKESLEMCKNLGIREGKYFNYYVLGNMYLDIDRHEEAIFNLKEAATIAEGANNQDWMQDSAESLHQAYAGTQSYEEAYNALLTYKNRADSLANKEKEKELSNLKTQLELNRQNEVNRLLQEKQEHQEAQLQIQLILIVAAALIIILIIAIMLLMWKTAQEKEEILEHVKIQKEELEILNKSKNNLFAIIAHDLRAPLTSMQVILYMIKNKVLSQKDMNELIQEMEISIQKNVDVMEDLLSWAKEQLSGVRMELQEIKLKLLVDDVVASQEMLVNKKDITIIHNIGKDSVVEADKNAVKLIFRNLISNAIKYTRPGDKIEINTKDKSSHVLITVEDTGIGIPEEAAKNIFNTKTWTREGTSKEKGSGFGLSITKDFVERMDGKIWFESKEDKGTIFFVELPKP